MALNFLFVIKIVILSTSYGVTRSAFARRWGGDEFEEVISIS